MHKYLIGLLAAASASVAPAAVINLNLGVPSGNEGTSHTYTTVDGNVVASGFTAPTVTGNLFGKNNGGNEVGLGLMADPNGQDEIYSATGGGKGTDFIQLNLSALFGHVSSVDFFMNSTTLGEGWAVYGSNTAGAGAGTWLLNGNDEGSSNSHVLPDFGQFTFYDFYSTGTNGTSFGNVLIGGLTLNSAVPEPATWAMMLIGFGAIGWQLRRRKRVLPQIA